MPFICISTVTYVVYVAWVFSNTHKEGMGVIAGTDNRVALNPCFGANLPRLSVLNESYASPRPVCADISAWMGSPRIRPHLVQGKVEYAQ